MNPGEHCALPLVFQAMRGNRPQEIVISLLVSVWGKEKSRVPISTGGELVAWEEFSHSSDSLPDHLVQILELRQRWVDGEFDPTLTRTA